MSPIDDLYNAIKKIDPDKTPYFKDLPTTSHTATASAKYTENSIKFLVTPIGGMSQGKADSLYNTISRTSLSQLVGTMAKS